MNYTIKSIKRAFGHRLQGNLFMKNIVSKTLLLLSPNLIDYICSHCWFVSSFEDGWAFTLKGDELKKDEYLIFLSDELLRENENQIKYTILHEIGHVILGHKNAIRAPQSKSEIKKQEKEADEFVKRLLSKN